MFAGRRSLLEEPERGFPIESGLGFFIGSETWPDIR